MSSQINQVLVPIDFGEQCRIALKQSYNLAKFLDAEITLVNVIDGDFVKSVQDVVSGNI